ncbi:MAG: cupredoxin domain-containing protein [Dehalococcoidia bacterium]|nr:cupredoxin domain-containing protein [Dehalococcoidia bacterium]
MVSQQMQPRWLAAVAFTVVSLAAIALGAGVGHAAQSAVSVQGFAFNPASVTLNVGDSITWTNNDAVPHTATSDTAGVFDVSLPAGGGPGSFTFTTAGTFTYHCNIHPQMKGSVVVLAASTAGSTSTAAAPGAPSAGTGHAGGGGMSLAALGGGLLVALGVAAAGGGALLRRRRG